MKIDSPIKIPGRFPTKLALLCTFIAPLLPPPLFAEENKPRIVGDFEDSKSGWGYYGGYEFKGAQGSIEVDTKESHEGEASLRLEADFSQGGSYVAAHRTLLSSASSLAFWVKAPGLKALDLRVEDSSGQTFQHQVPLKNTPEWQRIEVGDFADTKNAWSGADDGQWYSPLRKFSIMLAKYNLAEGKDSGSLWIDDVSVLEEPIAPPIAMVPTSLSGNSIFGFSSHMMHNDFFYERDKMGPYWRLEHILPWVVNGHFGVMREPLYQPWFAGPERDKEEIKRNRAMVESYLKDYSAAGVRVLLCPMFSRVGKPGFDEFFEWLGSLPKKYPCVAGFELGNEPHLPHFGNWKGGEYAEAVKSASRTLSKEAPDSPVIIGSMSHLWWGPAIKFIQTALQNGALDSADGISVHPYRKDQAPEGGAMHSDKNDPNGLETEMRDFWAMIQRYNTTGKPLELQLTEFGFSSGKGEGALAPEQSAGIGNQDIQADYLSRMMLVLFDLRLRGVPIKGLYWYDLKADRNDPVDLEANFGLLDYDASRARPGYTAYARLAKMFENTGDWWALDKNGIFSTKSSEIKQFAWKRISDGALILSFWRFSQAKNPGKNFASDLEISVPENFVPGAVTLHDLNRAKTKDLAFRFENGKLRLAVEVTSRAAWVEVTPRQPRRTKVVDLWQHALPAEFQIGEEATARISAPHNIELGVVASLELTVDNTASSSALEGVFNLNNSETKFSVEAGKKISKVIPLPEMNADGAIIAAYYFLSGDTMAGRGDFTIVVTDPIQVAAPLTLTADGKLNVALKNIGTRKSFEVTKLAWTSNGKSGETRSEATIAPGETLALKAKTHEVAPFTSHPMEVSIQFEDHPPIAIRSEAGYSPVHRLSGTVDANLDEWKELASIDLNSGTVQMEAKEGDLKYGGRKDLSGRVWIGRDENYFYLAAAITDDIHHQTITGEKVFQGDNIQFGLSTLSSEGMAEWHELGLTMTPNGAEVWRWMAPEGIPLGAVKSAKASTRRDGNVTYYECAVPWSELAPLGPDLPAFRFSFLLNENDSKGRKGWIEWGSGIGKNKNPELYRVVEAGPRK